MHSVCPQIRPTAFNRLDASSCLAPLDKQLKPFPANDSDSFPLPFLSFFLGGMLGVKKGVMGSVGAKRGEKWGTIQFVRFVVHHV